MPLDSTLYVTTEDGQLTIIHHVTDYRLGVWPLWRQTYRDLFTGGTAEVLAAVSTSTEPSATIPVSSAQGSTVSGTSFANLINTSPDDLAHVQPRAYISYETGYFIAQNSAVIPTAIPALRSIAVVFTAATTDICTSVAHGFLTNDVVSVSSTTTLPTGLSASTLYQVCKIDADTFKLRVKGGAIVDITGAGAGTHTIVLVENATPDVPTTLPTGVRFFPMHEAPRLSSTDPRTA